MLLHGLAAGVISSLIALADGSSVSRNPLKAVEAVRASSISTPNHRVAAHSRFDLSFHAFKRRIRFALEPNDEIIASDAQVHYLDRNGNIARSEPIDRKDHKVFMGDVWSQNLDGSFSRVGHARATVYRDGDKPLFEAAFDVAGDFHHVQLSSRYSELKHPLDPHIKHSDEDSMVIFRDSDLSAVDPIHGELKRRAVKDYSCGSDTLDFNLDPEHPVYSTGLDEQGPFWSTPINNLFGKRQMDTSSGPGNSGGVNLISTIGQTSGCPSVRRIALVGVATDCSYTGTFKSTEDVRSNIIQQISSASSLYEKSFNISLGLQNLTISPADCPGSAPASAPWNVPCGNGVDIQQRLNLFSTWRGKQADSNSHWTLLTNCPSGSAVGLAWLGQACIVNADSRNATSGAIQTVSGANVVAKTPTEWQVIAHETGHTFGAVHDCMSTTCSDGTSTKQQCCPLSAGTCDAGQKYIMNPSTGQGISNFSPCSIGNICSAMGRNSVKTTCFSSNKAVPLITGAQCGNGIVEEGEDCDCGGTASCGNNACCNPTTCKFINGAVCDDSNEECCKSCQMASASTICRPSTGFCDPEERCNGTSPTCPADKTADDGTDCGGGLKCATGHCTSRDLQCKTLMGSYTSGNDTYACDSQTCTLSCASPEFGRGVCYGLQQNFLDGTPCGGGGKCSNVSAIDLTLGDGEI
jgi:hypothetical protein